MGEYEDRYPDSFGRGEETASTPQHRHFVGLDLPRQVRDDEPAIAEKPDEAPPAPPLAQSSERHHEHPRRVFIEREPRVIQEDVQERLGESPFVDAAGISVLVEGSTVTLDGTVDSLFAVSVAKSLASNVPGVSRVQAELRVVPTLRSYAVAPAAAG